MIDIDLFYIAAGLMPPLEWEVQRLAAFRREVFSKIPDFLQGNDFLTPDFSRRTGKTTRIIVETLHAEWHGYDTAIVCRSVVEQYYVKSRYNDLKRLISAKFGPPLVVGKSSIITQRSQKYYSEYKILLDIT